MKKSAILLILFFCNLYIFAQNVTIRGYVTDALTTENLINATVRIQNTQNAVYTNQFGYYNISAKKGDTITLVVFYLGYNPEYKTLRIKQNSQINFKLIENNNLDSIIISAEKQINQTLETGTHQIHTSQIKLLPSLGCENDILKTVQLMPGIQTGNEGSNGLYVRGGNTDENLILLDDVPLYNVNHIGGFISVFNPDAINSAKIIKSGFPAKYGGRLSSVLDIRMNDGNLNKFSGNFSISPITSNFSINGPIKKDTTSFILSARALYLGLLAQPITFLQFDGSSLGYNFYDVNFKLKHKINYKNHIYLSFYQGKDNSIYKLNNFLTFNTTIGGLNNSWGNKLVAFRWNHIFNSNLFLNTTIAYTNYQYSKKTDLKNTIDNESYFYLFKTGINDFILKTHLEYFINNKLKINAGINNNLHNFTPAYSQYKFKNDNETIDTTYRNESVYGFDNNIYLEANYSPFNFLSSNIGIRINDYYVENKHFISYEPRILLILKLNSTSSIKTSYAKNQQNIHLITSSSATLPMDIWATSNRNLPPSNSEQITAGFYKSFKKRIFEFSIETYYKKSTNIVAFKEGATYLSIIGDWTDKLENNGIGKSYGIEFLIQKKQGKTTGWISYTLSRATRQFENINYNKIYPFKYDRLHNLNIVLTQNLGKNKILSANWIFGSGYPFTLPIARYEIHNEILNDTWLPSNQAIIYADRNSYRMRAYHRLDIAISFNKEKKRGTRTWKISIYNVYNRKNPYFYFSKYTNGTWQIYQQSLFPIIPTFSYSFKFN